MSNIGSKDNSLGKKYELVIANGTEEVFQQLKKLNIYNKVIISIPTNSETGEDEIGAASVWMTDSKGKLYQLVKPINNLTINETIIKNRINEIIDEKIDENLNQISTTILNKVNSLGVDDLKDAFRNILESEKNTFIDDLVNNISESIKQTFGIDQNITQEVSKAYEKINSVNKKLNEDINKIIWNNPNIAYLSHIVRILCSKHDIQYEFDNEYSESEVLHTEHHNLIQKIEELEQRLDELQNNGH